MRRELRGHDGITLVADVRGAADAPPVVLAHGGGQTRRAWGRTGERLARAGYLALSLDLRGHGESDWAPDGRYGVADIAPDAVAVAGQLERRPVWVGASLGGLMGLVAASSTDPPPFRALVLVDIAPRIELEGVRRIFAFMSAYPDGFTSVEEAADAVARYLPHRPRPRDLSGLRKNLRRRPDGRLVWHWDPRLLEQTREEFDREVVHFYGAARALRLPTLVVRGRRSDVLSEEGARELVALVPGAEFVDVSDAHHMVAGDDNDAFSAAVVAFIQALPDQS
ncbi:MAG: alpha/beta fold hydrolase [Deltaproteobacteria bacterium]|nr:alpha/beta fold hydrolase [Deltaproteobacteria bacterium]